MANSKAGAEGPLRVVVIEYHHIQTDVSNFKSVVQSLTGKNSSVADGGGESCRKRQRVEEKSIINVSERRRFEETTSFLHSASFKDLDRLLNLHLPSIEDLNWIWAD